MCVSEFDLVMFAHRINVKIEFAFSYDYQVPYNIPESVSNYYVNSCYYTSNLSFRIRLINFKKFC